MSDRNPAERIAEEIRAPRSAGIAGVIFAIVLLAVLVLLHTSVPPGQGVPQWLGDADRRRSVGTALALIPFAGISFLWFIGVVRTRLGSGEDRLFATVFLGSGLLFVGMLFTSAAFLATGLVLYDAGFPIEDSSVVAVQLLTRELMGSFGARMAAVFAISVSSVALRARLAPRWLILLGYLTGAVLLLSPPLTRWFQVGFPVWVLVLSVRILMIAQRGSGPSGAE